MDNKWQRLVQVLYEHLGTWPEVAATCNARTEAQHSAGYYWNIGQGLTQRPGIDERRAIVRAVSELESLSLPVNAYLDAFQRQQGETTINLQRDVKHALARFKGSRTWTEFVADLVAWLERLDEEHRP